MLQKRLICHTNRLCLNWPVEETLNYQIKVIIAFQIK